MRSHHSLDRSPSTPMPPPPLKPSSRPSAKEDRTVKERVEILLERLDRTKDVLVHDCSRGDRFGLLALGTLERTLKELVPVVKMIEQSRDAVVEKEERDSKKHRDQEEEENGNLEPVSRSRSASVSRHRSNDYQNSLIEDIRSRTEKDHPKSRRESIASSLPRESTSPAALDSLPDSRLEPEPEFWYAEQVTSEEPHNRPRSGQNSISKIKIDMKKAAAVLGLYDKEEEDSPRDRRQTSSRPPSAAPTFESKSRRASKDQERILSDEDKEPDTRARGSTRKDSHRRQTSVASDQSFSVPIHDSSSRSRKTQPIPRQENDDTEKEDRSNAFSYPRTRSTTSSRATSRAGGRRSEQTTKALKMASAPPDASSDEGTRVRRRTREKKKKVVVVKLNEDKIIESIAKHSDQTTKSKLLQVSDKYYEIVHPILYESITVSSVDQLDRLLEMLEETKEYRSPAKLVSSLEILPLHSDVKLTHDAKNLVPRFERLYSLLPNIERFSEDFTTSDYDVSTLSGYPPIGSNFPRTLVSFISRRSWWEISAVDEIIQNQPRLAQPEFGGAVVDREWTAAALKRNLLSQDDTRLSPVIESLSVSQIMHEDTLSVLLLLCANPLFRHLSLSYQSSGPSEDDTPFSSIPLALKIVSSSLTHFTLVAPSMLSSSRVTEDTSTLLEEILPLLPNLTHLAFEERIEKDVVVPIVTAKILTKGVLPNGLKSLTARRLFSISTKEVLEMLEKDPEVIPVLEELDLEWTNGGDEGKSEFANGEHWNEREAGKIRRVCGEYGIKCSVEKGDRGLSMA
ncbi:uncharacterized protein JCM6883_005341 [Sporobolomyces salmoneus]|uniref:uncharacterized protein n=1 Tax=Sporobolomyces salmoneus TaxID=183962 RepID=UPI003178D3BD